MEFQRALAKQWVSTGDFPVKNLWRTQADNWRKRTLPQFKLWKQEIHDVRSIAKRKGSSSLPEHSLFSKKAPGGNKCFFVCVCMCVWVCLFVFCLLWGSGRCGVACCYSGSVYLDVFTSYVHWVELQRESKKPVWFDSLFSLIHRFIWVNEER